VAAQILEDILLNRAAVSTTGGNIIVGGKARLSLHMLLPESPRYQRTDGSTSDTEFSLQGVGGDSS
jgi:hypothetical protein